MTGTFSVCVTSGHHRSFHSGRLTRSPIYNRDFMDGTAQHGIELAAACAAAAFMAWAVRGRSSSVFGPSVWRGPRRPPRRGAHLRRRPQREHARESSTSWPATSVPATFFQCGANVERLPDVARAVAPGRARHRQPQPHPSAVLLSLARASSNRTWPRPGGHRGAHRRRGPPGSARPSARAGSGWAGRSGGWS